MENKKQFAFSVAIEGWNQDTIEFALKLGYKKGDLSNKLTAKYIVNNEYGCMGIISTSNKIIIKSKSRILCNWQTEQELCKALLAATVGGMVYDQEYMVSLNGIIDKANWCINKGISNSTYWRKPTSEELINYFRKPGEASLNFSNSENHTLKLPPVNTNINMVSNSSETRKIKGYPAPFDMKYYKISKGTLFKKSIERNGLCYSAPSPVCGSLYFPAEIVEKWEPEYEESVEDKLRVILNKMGSQDEVIEKIKQLFTNNK